MTSASSATSPRRSQNYIVMNSMTEMHAELEKRDARLAGKKHLELECLATDLQRITVEFHAVAAGHATASVVY